MAKIDVKRCFKSGTQVEVSMEKKGFRNSWYVATVITPPTPPSDDDGRGEEQGYTLRNKRVMTTTIEYRHLMDEEAEEGRRGRRKRLREAVDVVQLRPIPPREKRRKVEFQEGDLVDAYMKDGWWEGTIVKVLDGGRRFGVYFRDKLKIIGFEAKDLRVHREWVYGNWDPPLLPEDDNENLKSPKALDG